MLSGDKLEGGALGEAVDLLVHVTVGGDEALLGVGDDVEFELAYGKLFGDGATQLGEGGSVAGVDTAVAVGPVPDGVFAALKGHGDVVARHRSRARWSGEKGR